MSRGELTIKDNRKGAKDAKESNSMSFLRVFLRVLRAVAVELFLSGPTTHFDGASIAFCARKMVEKTGQL
jgi:hypothetical protein